MRKTTMLKLCSLPAGTLSLLLLAATCLLPTDMTLAQTDWSGLEKQLPQTVIVGPESEPLGYHFERDRRPVKLPEEYLTGGAEAVRALKRGLKAGRIDTLVGLVLLAQHKDRAALEELSRYLNHPPTLVSLTRPTAAAIPFVLRYNLPDDEWPPLFIEALEKSPTYADSSMIACLTRYDIPEAENIYWYAYGKVDAQSQYRIINRLAPGCTDDRRLWRLLILTGIPEVQNTLLDRLEDCGSKYWPAQADSLAYFAWGDAAHRVLAHASQTDTAVYRPLLRAIVHAGETKEWVIEAALRLSAEGDTGSIPGLYSRIFENDKDLRAVIGLALCRLGDGRGIGACIRLGLKNEKYRDEVIEALEDYTGLAYGGDDEKWLEYWDKIR
jgi:hypothetical protein